MTQRRIRKLPRRKFEKNCHKKCLEKVSGNSSVSLPEFTKFHISFQIIDFGKSFRKIPRVMTRNCKIRKKSGKSFRDILWVTARFLEIVSGIYLYGLSDWISKLTNLTLWTTKNPKFSIKSSCTRPIRNGLITEFEIQIVICLAIKANSERKIIRIASTQNKHFLTDFVWTIFTAVNTIISARTAILNRFSFISYS